jgi:hypothetical protein
VTNTDIGRNARTDRTAERARGVDDVRVLASTETRRSSKTSELWLAIASFAAIVVAGYFSEAFSVDRAWLFATIVMAAYLVSRGLAKAGSRDLEERDIDLRR